MRKAEPPELTGLTYSSVLGSGGFSDVFLYEQQLPKRKVAVKVLLTESLTPQTQAAFVAEANLMAQLSAHPYIVTIYNADVAEDGRPFLVMEYCSGPSLGEQYKRKPFSVADALRVGVRISSAVATAHAAGILHRDIKPANVLTNDYGWPALTDFGISSALEEELPVHTSTVDAAIAADTGATGSGQTVGMSIPWSPPEMFEDEPQPDVRSDVFSLAATIYTLLAGHTPFEVKGRPNGALDLIGRIERGVVTPMPRADLPRTLVAVLAKGMATDREHRFSSAIELGRALQRVEMELGYVPTALDVPNLVVEEAEAPQEGSSEEETRVRQVSVIDAQPLAPAVPPPVVPTPVVPQPTGAQPTGEAPLPESTVIRGSAVADHTQLRPTPAAVEPPTAEPTPGGESATSTPTAPRRKAPIFIGVAAAVLIAGVVTTAVLFSGTLSNEAEPEPTGGGDQAVIDTLDAPELATAVVNDAGDVVTFPVSNPESQDGDAFRWYPLSNPGDTTVVLESESAEIEVTGVTPGTEVCIGVMVQRSGQLSAPTEGCSP